MSQRPLSTSQKTQLGIVSTAAYKHQLALGRVTVPGDMAKESKTAQMKFWIHQEIAASTKRVCTASDMVDDEYLSVKSHFQLLTGEAGKAFDTAHRDTQGAACHREPGCEYVRQMHHWLSKAGYAQGYMIAIMKAKFKGISEITRLNEWQLKQLHDTVVNRCRAKLGLGDDMNRNKKQRAKPVAAPAKAWSSEADVPAKKERTYILHKPAPQRPDPADIVPPENCPF